MGLMRGPLSIMVICWKKVDVIYADKSRIDCCMIRDIVLPLFILCYDMHVSSKFISHVHSSFL